MKTLICLFFSSFFLFSCAKKETKTDALPVLDLNTLSEDSVIVNLSSLIDDFYVIPLETSEKSLFSYVNYFNICGDYILAGTQEFPGPARLYRFDWEGNFINEIGHPGNGPGEHTGYAQTLCNCYPEEDRVEVKWFGDIQLFNFEGKHLGNLKTPEDVYNLYRFSDSVWFSSGSLAAYPFRPMDSLALVFFDQDGAILNDIKRQNYPSGKKAFSPISFGSSI